MANGAEATVGFSERQNRSRGGMVRWIVLPFLFLSAILCAHALIVQRFLAADNASAAFLHLASQHAFLCQRMKFLSGGVLARDSASRGELEETLASYEGILLALETGREPDGRALPPKPRQIEAPISALRETWGRLRPTLARTLSAPSNELATHVRQGLAQLDERNSRLEAALDEWRQTARRNLMRLVAAVSLLGLGALVIWSKLVLDELVRPLRRVRDHVLSALERPLAEMPENEIDAVTRAVAQLSSDVDQLRRERALVRNELRRARADYDAIFDNAVAGILRSDADGAILMVNGTLARILGFASIDEMMARVTDVHRQLFADPNHRAHFEELHGQRGHLELETRVRRKDGATLWVLESGNVGEGRDGSKVYETVLVDITPVKQAQESLRQLSAHLLKSQDRERRRIARELHDSTGQLLAALALNLGRLDEMMPFVRESLSSSIDLASECTRQIRSMSYLLHPPMLEELGLLYALRDYTRGFSQRSGVQVALDAPAEMARLSPDTELALFRVVQEALANIQRHSESRDALVRIVADTGSIRLEVEDHGRGISPDLITSNGEPSMANMGVGLRGMEERLRQLGGRLTVESRRGRTLVRAEVPIEDGGERGELTFHPEPEGMKRPAR